MTRPKIINVASPDTVGYMTDVVSVNCENAERDTLHDALRATTWLLTDMLLAVGDLRSILDGYRDTFYMSNLGLSEGTPADRGLDTAYHVVAGTARDSNGGCEPDAPFEMVGSALRTAEAAITLATQRISEHANRVRADVDLDVVELMARLEAAAWSNNRYIDQEDD